MRLIVTGAAALGFVFASAAVPALAQKSGGTLRVLHRDTPASASIHEEATISVNMPYMSVFNNLVFFDPKEKINSPDKIVPELATAWSWNADKTKLTFTLREGVKWHDGKPFTSADVVCTWNQLIGKKDDRVAEAFRNLSATGARPLAVTDPGGLVVVGTMRPHAGVPYGGISCPDYVAPRDCPELRRACRHPYDGRRRDPKPRRDRAGAHGHGGHRQILRRAACAAAGRAHTHPGRGPDRRRRQDKE